MTPTWATWVIPPRMNKPAPPDYHQPGSSLASTERRCARAHESQYQRSPPDGFPAPLVHSQPRRGAAPERPQLVHLITGTCVAPVAVARDCWWAGPTASDMTADYRCVRSRAAANSCRHSPAARPDHRSRILCGTARLALADAQLMGTASMLGVPLHTAHSITTQIFDHETHLEHLSKWCRRFRTDRVLV